MSKTGDRIAYHLGLRLSLPYDCHCDLLLYHKRKRLPYIAVRPYEIS